MRQVKKDSTNVSVELFILDSVGEPATGLAYDTTGIDLNYRRDGAAVSSISEVDLAALTTAHTDGGFKEIANGRYRLDLPDAAVATGVSQVTVGGTITGYTVLPLTVQLVDYDPDDAVRMGITALPNAAADAAGGLPISDAGGLDLDAKLANTNEITASRMGALTDWIDGGRLDLILDSVIEDTGTTLPATLTDIKAVTDVIPNSGALSDLTDYVAYCVCVLVGAINNAGTATETFDFTLGGTAYRATYAGLDDNGNRGTTVLSKP